MSAFPLADADKCVKCALCLPHCPTYRESLDESESPRGRIALMQGFVTSALAITPTLAGHLDRCLACRACEVVCPAEVPYGKLIDAARGELLRHGYREPLLALWFGWWMRSPARLRVLHMVLWLAQRLGLNKIAAISPSLARSANLLPPLSPPRHWQPLYAASNDGVTEVQLFLGCIARVVQPEITIAAIYVLNALGYSVRLPEAQTCCGALDQHSGRVEEAAALAIKNLEAFAANATTPLLHTASGCGATLGEYPLLVTDSGAHDFSARSRDISDFLVATPRLKQTRFKPWPVTVLVHSPCTLKNVLKTDKSMTELLSFIPNLKVESLPGSTGCCGAAGTYMLNEPEIAERLANHIVALVEKARPTALVTSNVGCALHLRANLQRHGLDIAILHPVEILARQLDSSAYTPAL